MMNFMDATVNMINGKHLTRSIWSGFYLTILSGQNYIWSIGKDNAASTNSSIYTPSVDDILATDWMVKIN